MPGVEAEHEPVEEVPPDRRAVDEQTVHRRRQPQRAHRFRQRRLAAHRTAVDAHHAASLGPRRAGAHRHGAAQAFDAGGDRPAGAGSGAAAAQIAKPGAAQAGARRQQRERFEEIGLAGAVGPGEHHRARVGRQLDAGETAEVGQRQPRNRHRPRRRLVGRHRLQRRQEHPVTPASASARRARRHRRCRAPRSARRNRPWRTECVRRRPGRRRRGDSAR